MNFDDREPELDGPECDRAVGAPRRRRRQLAADEERVRRQQPAPPAGTDGRRASELVDGGRAIGGVADE